MADQLSAEEDLDRLPTDKELARLQRTTVLYYLHETNPDNGLVRDKTDTDSPCSIAAVGLALATIPAVVERAVQHRGRRSRPGDDPGCCRARRAHSQVRREGRPPQTSQPDDPPART